MSNNGAEVRENPFLSLNGVVKYMAAASASQREKILHGFKYPEPEGKAQAGYYSPARDLIRSYHAENNNAGLFERGVGVLRDRIQGASPSKASKLENNIRALLSYHRHFGNQPYRPLEVQIATVVCEGVDLWLRPDLLAQEGRRTRFIRYNFGKDGPDKDELRYSTQLLYLAARHMGTDIQKSDCLLLIAAEGKVHKLDGVMSTFDAKLRASMREAKRIWMDL